MKCKIFRDPEKNRIIDSNADHIGTIGIYNPKYEKSYKEMDEFSNMILTIKMREKQLHEHPGQQYYYKKAIKDFVRQFKSILSGTEEFAICLVPNHEKGFNQSGMRIMAKDLCKSPIIDATDVLERNTTIDEKHTSGGSRDFDKEIQSLTLRNADKILNKQVLLLDDITTTGTSLKAGKHIIMKAWPELVVMYALGKTQLDKGSNV